MLKEKAFRSDHRANGRRYLAMQYPVYAHAVELMYFAARANAPTVRHYNRAWHRGCGASCWITATAHAWAPPLRRLFKAQLRMRARHDKLGFFREFLRHPLQTGAFVPSSAALASLLIDVADIRDARFLVELGSGTGVCTERILRRKPAAASFLVLEINPDFAKRTKQRCPAVELYLDSAAHLERYIGQTGGRGFDAILSGLPWAAFGNDLQDHLLDIIMKCLAAGGRFVTFAYLQGLLLPSGLRFRKKLRRKFPFVRSSRVVWANVPPAFVYSARRESESDPSLKAQSDRRMFCHTS